MPPRPHLALPSPGTRRAVVVGAGSFGTAVAVLLARGGFRTTLQTRTPEQCARLEADRENTAYLPGVELPRELRIESAASGLGRVDYVFLGVPSVGLGEVIAEPLRARARPPHAGDLARQGPRAAARDRPDGAADREPRRRARRLRRRARARARDGHRGRGARRRLGRRAARRDDRRRLHPRRRRLRAARATRSASSSPAPPRTPPRWPRARRRPRASTPPAPPPGTSSSRSGATPSSRARGRSR